MKTLIAAITWIGLLALVMLSYVACAQQGAMTDAMRQQEAEMTDESSAWNDRLAQWRSQHEEMRAWHAHHQPAGAGGSELDRHLARLTVHEQAVAEFQTRLDTHRAKLQQEEARPEGQRAASHSDRWAEHIQLKDVFEALGKAHDQIAKEHEQALEKRQPRAS